MAFPNEITVRVKYDDSNKIIGISGISEITDLLIEPVRELYEQQFSRLPRVVEISPTHIKAGGGEGDKYIMWAGGTTAKIERRDDELVPIITAEYRYNKNP